MLQPRLQTSCKFVGFISSQYMASEVWLRHCGVWIWRLWELLVLEGDADSGRSLPCPTIVPFVRVLKHILLLRPRNGVNSRSAGVARVAGV
jgi:hypothetical protein